jgi:hypothetical protein
LFDEDASNSRQASGLRKCINPWRALRRIFRQESIRTYFTETEQGLVLKIIFMAINPQNSFEDVAN